MTTPDNGPPPAAGVGSSADMQADIEADREAQQLNTERIGQAFSALEEGRRDAARELMEQVLDDGRVSAGGAAYVWAILQELGDAERAKMIRDGTVGTLRKVIADHPDNPINSARKRMASPRWSAPPSSSATICARCCRSSACCSSARTPNACCRFGSRRWLRSPATISAPASRP